jgi:hypothetical protein
MAGDSTAKQMRESISTGLGRQESHRARGAGGDTLTYHRNRWIRSDVSLL